MDWKRKIGDLEGGRDKEGCQRVKNLKVILESFKISVCLGVSFKSHRHPDSNLSPLISYRYRFLGVRRK